MKNIEYSLCDYLAKIEEAFALPIMTEGQQEVAKHEFNTYVRENKLSINDAIGILGDTKQILPFIVTGIKSNDFDNSAKQKNSVDSSQQITNMREDINSIMKAVNTFVSISEETSQILLNLEQFSKEAGTRAGKNEKLLGEVHLVATDLKKSMVVAIDASKDVVEKLKGIPPRLDGQLQKIESVEKGIQEAAAAIITTHDVAEDVKDQTDPVKTHRENTRMMWKNIAYGTIISTAVGTAAGFLINNKIDQDKESHQPPPAKIEKQDQPRSYIIHNKTTGKTYEIEEFPNNAKTPAQKIGSDDYLDAGASRPDHVREQPKSSAELKN